MKLYIFLAGFAITGVEMAASRFLAPYFGTSSIVWANVIGVILLAMAVGYAVGGKLVDKHPHRRAMFLFGAIGALLLGLLPLAARLVLTPLSGGLLNTEVGTIFATFFASLLLFGLPIFFLGMLSPYAVRLLSEDLAVVGSRSGLLSFLSTVGSILGIYITSLFLIPFVGVRETIWLFAGVLFVASMVGLGVHRRVPLSLAALAIVVVNVLTPPPTILAFGTLMHQQESTYQHIKVVENGAGTRFLYFNEGQGIQSMYHPEQRWTGQYYDYAAPLPSLERFAGKKDLHVLILGYAGGTIGKMLQQSAPTGMTVHIDGVEIDPVVTRLSKDYFGVTEEERAIYTMDGRSFLRQTDKQYDLVVIDAYSQEIYIPAHMITQEFFREVAARMTPEGMIIFNLNAIDRGGKLFQGAINTLQDSGLHRQFLPVPGTYNHWIVASKAGVDFRFAGATEDTRLQELQATWRQAVQVFPDTVAGPGRLTFTDNNSPVEMLVHEEIVHGFLKK